MQGHQHCLLHVLGGQMERSASATDSLSPWSATPPPREVAPRPHRRPRGEAGPSRQERSDFHARTVSGAGIVHDREGSLVQSTDGRRWERLTIGRTRARAGGGSHLGVTKAPSSGAEGAQCPKAAFGRRSNQSRQIVEWPPAGRRALPARISACACVRHPRRPGWTASARTPQRPRARQ
jgi:hypothetical protein